MERWAKPVKIVELIPNPGETVMIGGRTYSGTEFLIEAEDFDRVRLGYVCLQCMEPHPEAYPQFCTVCQYPMREYQARDVAKNFQGEKNVGPAMSLNDELERLAENAERLRPRKSSILLPPGFNLGS